ncbi:long-chain-fatty-acid--CoA ligase [Corynebacterium timonense]|uniref:Long-chain acyl-CoA synthetase n=1 Tax=Corynebacterium timonense TaxID=441500 RepID=A0A1H1T8T7_9CORY|nr:long-chain-fatty-acid--CoA ligase [Corynebacterium timonense]SDS56632.1 long-chain acyl-CoA synthetase [Corynebacterium timonense]
MGAYENKAWLRHYADWTNPEPDLGEHTLVSRYRQSVAQSPDAKATWFMGAELTYGQLDEQVRRVAGALAGLGVKRGDRVVIALPNCPQHVVSILAVHSLGAAVVEHNPLYTAYELKSQVLDHGATVAIVWDKAAPVYRDLAAATQLSTIVSVNMIDAMPWHLRTALKLPLPSIRAKREELSAAAPGTIAFRDLLAADAEPPHTEVTQEDTAFILYTSGTTGEPKGAPLTHGNLNANLVTGLEWLEDWGSKEEKVLAILPLFHVYGLLLNFSLAISNASQIILVPAPKPELMYPAIEKTKPTMLPGVPTLYERIAAWATENNKDLTSIRNSFSGAATLPAATLAQWEKVTGGRLVEGYGLTETSPILTSNPMNGKHRPGYVGVPYPLTDIRIANPDNPAETMPDGEPGELLARGPQVFGGYLNKPEANERAFYDGWFRTGDMAIMEEDGFIRLVARIKEMIITGGFNVYPDEVEQVFKQHPDIDDIAVVGRPRTDGSEDVVACVALHEGAVLDPDGLTEFARERLTPYKVPRTFYYFDALERDQTGKIRRKAVQKTLLTMIEEGTARSE